MGFYQDQVFYGLVKTGGYVRPYPTQCCEH
jgi:hypothetical protein